MRVKKCDWFNPETREVFYGIQVHDGKQWCYTPLAFKTEAERDARLAAVRKSKPEDWERIPSPVAPQKGEK